MRWWITLRSFSAWDFSSLIRASNSSVFGLQPIKLVSALPDEMCSQEPSIFSSCCLRTFLSLDNSAIFVSSVLNGWDFVIRRRSLNLNCSSISLFLRIIAQIFNFLGFAEGFALGSAISSPSSLYLVPSIHSRRYWAML